jgi:hypothetical protein
MCYHNNCNGRLTFDKLDTLAMTPSSNVISKGIVMVSRYSAS